MIDCDYFEDQYSAWRNGKLPDELSNDMRNHQGSCHFCRSFSTEIAGIRDSLRMLPDVEPSPGFKQTLMNKVMSGNGAAVNIGRRRVHLMPRWAAMGAGLVFGLVFGFIFVYPLGEENMLTPSSNRVPSTFADANIDSNLLKQDSLNDSIDVDENGYDTQGKSQLVSGK